MRSLWKLVTLWAALGVCLVIQTSAQTTEFTYQGSLKNSATTANGNFDFEFLLFDALTGGSQVGPTITANTVAVANGTFSVKLDFGSNYPGASRYLEIHVRQTGGGAFTPLTPRQSVSSSPYTVKSLNADTAATATNASKLGGVSANQYVVTSDPRMTDTRPPTAGSANYIQNTSLTQASSNFNISGNGIIGGNVGIGTPNPATKLQVITTTGDAVNGQTSSSNGKGVSGYASSATGITNGVYGQSASPDGYGGFFVGNGYFSGNLGLGTGSPAERLHVVGRAIFNVPGNNGFRITPTSDADIGVLNVTNTANTVNWLTVSAGKVIMNGGNVGIGTLSPTAKLEVAGEVRVGVLHANPNSFISSPLSLCIEQSTQIVARCDFSSLRYKTNIATLHSGLDVVRRLRPITFDWKKDGSHDFGLGAEEVEKVDPNLVVHIDGKVDGVRYDRLGVVLINAVKEQQSQIVSQQKLIERQQREIDILKAFVCLKRARAAFCKSRN